MAVVERVSLDVACYPAKAAKAALCAVQAARVVLQSWLRCLTAAKIRSDERGCDTTVSRLHGNAGRADRPAAPAGPNHSPAAVICLQLELAPEA